VGEVLGEGFEKGCRATGFERDARGARETALGQDGRFPGIDPTVNGLGARMRHRRGGTG
jgi:hypothetical protein